MLDGLLRFFLNRGYSTLGAVSVKAMEIAIYICIAGTSIAFIYFFARLKTGETPLNPGTVILHQIPRDLFKRNAFFAREVGVGVLPYIGCIGMWRQRVFIYLFI